MLPARLRVNWRKESEICIFCAILSNTRSPLYTRKPIFAALHRPLHSGSASLAPPAEALAETSDSSARPGPAPSAPRSRFGGFASQRTSPASSQTHPSPEDAHPSRSRDTQHGSDDFGFADEAEKEAFGPPQTRSDTSLPLRRRLPFLDDPKGRPRQSGRGAARTDSSGRGPDAGFARQGLRGMTGTQHRIPDDVSIFPRKSGSSISTPRADNAPGTFDDIDKQEVLSLRQQQRTTESRQSESRTAPNHRVTAFEPSPSPDRRSYDSIDKPRDYRDMYAENLKSGTFNFGLDRAKETATGPPQASSPPPPPTRRRFDDRDAAPWGKHLRKRQTAAVAPDATSMPSSTASGDITTIRKRLPERSRPFAGQDMRRDFARGEPQSRNPPAFNDLSPPNLGERGVARRVAMTDSNEEIARHYTLHDVAGTRRREVDVHLSRDREAVGAAEPTQPKASIEEDDRLRRRSRHRQLVAEDEDEYTVASTFKSKNKKGARSASRSSRYDEEEDDFDEDYVSKRRKKEKQVKKEHRGPRLLPIEIPPYINVQGLATALKIRPEEFVEKLQELGFEQTAMDHILNAESAGLIAMEYNYEPIIDRSATEDLLPRPAQQDTTNLPSRPPVVTIMGHVDHGKTTLLDYLRKSSVAASEHGGITQHIGAFSVPIASANNRLVTFLDTPGHAAFLSMRQRGANVTDIVVLVVAADDSVKPQTIEAIRHAKNSGVQIIVAISKVDKEDADVQQVKQDLVQHDIEVEDFGGGIQAVEVSGKTGQGIPDLEEAIITLADVLEVRAESEGTPEGWVLEAATKLAGRSATVLVRRGTVRPGDILVAGTTWTRVRNLRNEAGVNITAATPGMPVEVDGWRDQPSAGDEVVAAPSESKATSAIAYRKERAERLKTSSDMEIINETRRLDAERRIREKEAADAAVAEARLQHGVRAKSLREAARTAKEQVNDEARNAAIDKTPTAYLIVKADVSGSSEAVANMLTSIPLDGQPVAIDILREGVGPVSESDIAHVAAAPRGHGCIVNFNQAVPAAMAALAERNGVKIIDETIIYKVVDEVKVVLEAWLPPVVTTRVVGEAEAAQVFEIKEKKKTSRVAGCKVRNGTVRRSGNVRVYRGGIGGEGAVVFDGKMASLRLQKKDVSEMRKGTECGISFEHWDNFQVGDMIQCYEEKSEPRKLK